MSDIKCSCGNTARYVSQRGHLTCSLCPLRAHEDSIRIKDVPIMLSAVRDLIAYVHEYRDEGLPKSMIQYARYFRELLGKDVRQDGGAA